MRYKLLVVDDEQEICIMLKEFFGMLGYTVYTANSAKAALGFLSAEPDLILLDIQMTPKNGIDTLRDIRSMRDRSDIPVIMLTGVEDKESVLASFKLGICDYILKPFSSDDLLKRIRMVFEPENQSDMES